MTEMETLKVINEAYERSNVKMRQELVTLRAALKQQDETTQALLTEIQSYKESGVSGLAMAEDMKTYLFTLEDVMKTGGRKQDFAVAFEMLKACHLDIEKLFTKIAGR